MIKYDKNCKKKSNKSIDKANLFIFQRGIRKVSLGPTSVLLQHQQHIQERKQLLQLILTYPITSSEGESRFSPLLYAPVITVLKKIQKHKSIHIIINRLPFSFYPELMTTISLFIMQNILIMFYFCKVSLLSSNFAT